MTVWADFDFFNPPPQMFMLSVLWSDQNEIIIYRSFQDFKEFHVRNKNIYISSSVLIIIIIFITIGTDLGCFVLDLLK